jgi:hypothetical protein
MAVPESQSFHQQTRDLLNSIALGGMKIDLQRGHRYTHPTFKGLPYNSTGSCNRMGFMTKAENDCPLEAKVDLAGGARTQKGQEFYQKKLKGVAEWTRNQQLMKEGLPPNPPNAEEFQLPLDESLHLELEQTLQNLNDLVDIGDFSSITASEFNKLPRLVIRYLATIEDSGVVMQLFNDFNTLTTSVYEEAYPSDRGNEMAEETNKKRAERIIKNIVLPTVNLIAAYADFLNKSWDGSDESRKLGLRAAISSELGQKATLMKEADKGIYEWLNSLPAGVERNLAYQQKEARSGPQGVSPPFLSDEPYIQMPSPTITTMRIRRRTKTDGTRKRTLGELKTEAEARRSEAARQAEAQRAAAARQIAQ